MILLLGTKDLFKMHVWAIWPGSNAPSTERSASSDKDHHGMTHRHRRIIFLPCSTIVVGSWVDAWNTVFFHRIDHDMILTGHLMELVGVSMWLVGCWIERVCSPTMRLDLVGQMYASWMIPKIPPPVYLRQVDH